MGVLIDSDGYFHCQEGKMKVKIKHERVRIDGAMITIYSTYDIELKNGIDIKTFKLTNCIVNLTMLNSKERDFVERSMKLYRDVMEVANKLKKQVYIDDVIIKHEHQVWTGEKWDNLQVINDSFNNEDRNNYLRRKKHNFGIR